MVSISINSHKTKLLENMTLNKTNKIFKNNNSTNEKTDMSKRSITLNDNNKQSSLMENLLKQKDSLIEKKQALMEKDMDPKEKKSKLDDVNKQIQEIESQIQQLNIQEKQDEVQKKEDEILKKKVQEENYNKNQNGDEVKADIIISASLNELIKINSSKEATHLLKDSKNRQIVEAGYIKPNDDSNSYNNKRLAQISRSIPNLDMAASRVIADLNKSAERIKYKTKLAAKEVNDKLEYEEAANKKEAESTEDNETIKNNSKINEYNEKFTS